MEMVSGEVPARDEGSMKLSMARSYGTSACPVERRLAALVHILVLMLALTAAGQALAGGAASDEAKLENKPAKMVVLGDSLSAGLGLPAAAAFPARLQKALKDKGIEVDIINAG